MLIKQSVLRRTLAIGLTGLILMGAGGGSWLVYRHGPAERPSSERMATNARSRAVMPASFVENDRERPFLPAAAATFHDGAVVRVPGSSYQVRRDGDTCALAASFGDMEIYIFYYPYEGVAALTITNEGPPTPERKIAMTLRFDGKDLYVNAPGRVSSVGAQVSYIATFEQSLVEDYAHHQRLEVLADGRTIARILLNNTAKAFRTLGECALEVGTGG